MAIYVKGKYIPNNYVHAIRSACGKTDAKEFLMRKYRWKNLQSQTSSGNSTPNISKSKLTPERKQY